MSKKVIKDGINISENIKYKDINGNFLDKIPGNKWKIQVEGEFVDMSNNKGFNKAQIEQLQNLLQPINQRLENIENRLQNVESRLNVLESLPTIQKELKSKNKK